jgi:hypothetical protein
VVFLSVLWGKFRENVSQKHVSTASLFVVFSLVFETTKGFSVATEEEVQPNGGRRSFRSVVVFFRGGGEGGGVLKGV